MDFERLSSLRPELQFAAELARETGALLRGLAESVQAANSKRTEVDLVTEADRKSEALLVDRIAREYPGHGVVAEEGTGRPQRSAFRWLVDPLDGTTNFAHGYPHYAVSLALQENGTTVVGVVYDVFLGELFVAERGRGAFLNGQPLRVSSVSEIRRALLGTGFPYDRQTSPVNNFDHFVTVQKAAQGVRRDGSACLNLCYVACGRFDGYWEMKLNPWDVAAGALMVIEAGGRVTDFAGGLFDESGLETVATNGLLHDELVALLRGGLRPLRGS
jgi:myo-inositol-1(or 4)-monophosphatase